MHEAYSFLALERWPSLVLKNGLYLCLIGQWMEKCLDESEPNFASFGDQFQCGDIGVVSTNLAVSNYTVASKLKSRYTELSNGHDELSDRLKTYTDLSERNFSVIMKKSFERQSAKSGASEASAQRLSDVAYERILESLFERKVPVGAFISQNELSVIVDVPVAPLRDALRVLEAEGILTIHPRSGIQFIRPGLELTRSTYQFRSIVERAAVRVFAEEADENITNALEVRHSRLLRRVERDGIGPEQLLEMDALELDLHGEIIHALRNPLIESAYRRMHNYLRLLRLERKVTAPILIRTLKEHLDILEACGTRNADAAEKALQAHFQAAMQRNLGLV
ncbi:GntR family transcriptional regulator [Agrobacterium sp. BA1120]|uniref:GntR family transcriptional regulator n=1 Tax=Agrobacterium sp. BA1120 TaxID=3228927 RepID=UPI00336A0983